MLIRFSKLKNIIFEISFTNGSFGYKEVNNISKNVVETDKEGVCVYKTEGTIPKYLYFLSNKKFALLSKQEVEINKNLESIYRFTENRIKIKPSQILRAIVANIGPIKGYNDPKYLKENLNSIIQKYSSISSFLCDAIFLIEAGYKKYERQDLSFIEGDRGIYTLMVEDKDGNTGISVLHRPDIKIIGSNKITSKIGVIHGPDSNKGLNQNVLQSFKSRIDTLNTPFIIGNFNFEFFNKGQATESANSYAIKCKEYLKSIGYKYYKAHPIPNSNQIFIVDGMIGKSSYAPYMRPFMVLKNGHQVFEINVHQHETLSDLEIQKENIANNTTSLDKNKIIEDLDNFKTLFKLTKLTSEDRDVQQEIKENSYNYTLIANAQLRSSLSKYDVYGQYEYGYIAKNDKNKIVFISYENMTISNEESFEKIKQKLEDRK